jgi:uncharacterized protein (DUF433 family)
MRRSGSTKSISQNTLRVETASLLLDYLEGGHTLDEFLDEFPTVTREAAIAALEPAKNLVIAQTR